MSNFKWKIFSNFVAFSEYPNFKGASFNFAEFLPFMFYHMSLNLSQKKAWFKIVSQDFRLEYQ